MKRTILCLAWLLGAFSGSAQTWTTILPGEEKEAGRYIAPLDNGEFLLLAYQYKTLDLPTGLTGSGVQISAMRCNSYGEILWMRTELVPQTARPGAFWSQERGQFIVWSQVKGAGSGADLQLTSLSENGDLQFQKVYTLPNDQIPYAMAANEQGNMVVLCSSLEEEATILWIDEQGELSKHVTHRYLNAAQEKTSGKDGSVWAIALDEADAVYFAWEYIVDHRPLYGNLTKLETDGRHAWTKAMGEGSWIRDLKILPNGHILAAGDIGFARMWAFDAAGNEQWYQKYPAKEIKSIAIGTQEIGLLGRGPGWSDLTLFKTDLQGNLNKEYPLRTEDRELPAMVQWCQEELVGIGSFIPQSKDQDVLLFGTGNQPVPTDWMEGGKEEPAATSTPAGLEPAPPARAEEVKEPSEKAATPSFAIPSLLSREVAITAYPNPFANQVRFRFAGITEGTIAIYSIEGEEVNRQAIHSEDITVDLSSEAPGTYLYAVYDQGIKVAEGKVVKQ